MFFKCGTKLKRKNEMCKLKNIKNTKTDKINIYNNIIYNNGAKLG